MTSTLARPPPAMAVAAEEAPCDTSTSPITSRSGTASPPAEGQRADPVTGSNSSIGRQSPDPRAILRRLPSVAKVERKGGFMSYHKPIRPEPTPSNPPRERPATSRSSTDETQETGIIAIGVALGSPTDMPDYRTIAWRPQLMAGTGAYQIPSKEDSSKSKPRKWGVFGRSKSKRGKGSGAKQESQPASASTGGLARTMSSAAALRSAQDNGAQGAKGAFEPSRHKPNARPQTDPATGARMNAPMSIAREDNQERSSRKRRHMQGAARSSSESRLGANFLDVEIPDVTMERYSVMFGHLLQHGSTSLLENRQTTQDRLEAIEEVEANMRQMQLGKPSWGEAMSPMHLAPQKGGRSLGSSPRMRSNTSPAMLPSPPASQSSFEGSETPRKRLGTRRIFESTCHDSGIDEATATPEPIDRPKLISKFQQQPSSHQTNGPSATGERVPSMASDDKLQILVRSTSGHKITPSTWNSAHPPLSKSTPRWGVSQDGERPHPSSLTTKSSAASLSEEDPEKSPMEMVEVSIARQVSVSRHQRALPGTLQRGALGNRRIDETKSSTPRQVNSRQDADSPKAMHPTGEYVIVGEA
ncbi:Uncharacterized protein TCAP_05037 [Tolypocladium capitatum]|uniref:Uncharacterized protein n=1 Tax=Tolypocladium capitatum TaxID=45235 RepID=A0A2K3QBW0_9HYPO|nr:Uncharacterized protein TCAP_05037 [Tolypocladium capitatum]